MGYLHTAVLSDFGSSVRIVATDESIWNMTNVITDTELRIVMLMPRKTADIGALANI